MGFSQGHAIVIGVGSHQFASYIDVPISVTDAKAVVQVLQDPKVCGYPPGQVTLLHDNNATKGAILAAIRALVEDTKAEDTVFFFYCGHGALGNDGNYYLVSHDAKIDGSRVVAGTGLSESELLEQLRAIKAKRLLMVINSCFSGNISPTLAIDDQGLEASGLPEDTANALLGTGQGRILITACREDQKSYIGAGDLSIFTQALVDGLRGRGVNNSGGYIGAYNLYLSVYKNVSELVKEKLNIVQEPELTVLKGVGPFAVALYKGATIQGDFDTDQPTPGLPAVRQVKLEKSQEALARQINTGGGAYIGGNVSIQNSEFIGRDKIIHGDEVAGDKVGGDKISVGDISNSTGVAIGPEARSEVYQSTGLSGKEFEQIFEPLLQAVRNAPDDVQLQAEMKVEELKQEIKKGKNKNDVIQARLIDGIVGLVPGAVSAVVGMFASPVLAGFVGPATEFILDKIKAK